ncbi:hypothetical protein ISR92_03665 [Patescibacteria group bacterium]|nr:hypothetical protein [Patescibacteria group bacterium]
MATRKNKKRIEISFSRPDNLLRKRRIKKKFIIFLFALLVISLGLSIYFGIEDSRQDNKSAIFKIEAEKSIMSGDEIIYKVFFHNKDDADLTKLNLTLTYPRGFIYESSSIKPVNEGQNYWELDNLAPGFASNVEIRGRLIGDIGDQKTVKAILAYEPANFSSTFTQEEYFTQEISSLKIDMWVDYSPEAIPAQQVQFKVHILNKQTDNWQPLVLSFAGPDQFSILATDPSPTILDNQWEILKLDSEEEIIITIMGELAPGIISGILPFSVELFEEIDGDRKLLDENELPLDIINPNLSINLSFADGESTIVDWGEIVNYELVIKNEGEYVPDNIRLVLVFDTDFINWQSWKDTDGLYREGNKIIWTSDHPKIGSKLAGLKTGEEIRLKVGAKLQSEPIDAATLKSDQLLVSSVAKVITDVGIEEFVTTSDILRTRIGQNFNFVALARYYDISGKALGSGPIPPQVGRATIYAINWNLVTGLDNYKDISLTTTLPPYVSWLNDQEGYTARFNLSNKKLIIDSSALNADEELSGSFMLSITPEKSQVGQTLVLLNPMTLIATNKETGEEIVKQIDMVNTDLITDPFAQDKSRVVE